MLKDFVQNYFLYEAKNILIVVEDNDMIKINIDYDKNKVKPFDLRGTQNDITLYALYPKMFLEKVFNDFLQREDIISYTDQVKKEYNYDKKTYKICTKDNSSLIICDNNIEKTFKGFKEQVENAKKKGYINFAKDLIEKEKVHNMTITTDGSHTTSIKYHEDKHSPYEQVNNIDHHLIIHLEGEKKAFGPVISKSDLEIVKTLVSVYGDKYSKEFKNNVVSFNDEDDTSLNVEMRFGKGRVKIEKLDDVLTLGSINDKIETLIRTRRKNTVYKNQKI